MRRPRVALQLLLGAALLPAAVLAPTAQAASNAHAAKTKKLRPECRRGEHPHGRRHCVRVPSNVSRPRGHAQQGGPNNVVPPPTANGLGASGYDREESAIAWAQGLRHSQDYQWYCEAFVENAFNVVDQYKSAWEAAKAIGLHKGRPPRGALVFFRPDHANVGLGHVGIALNRSTMISALDRVEVSDLGQEYWRSRYAGWSYAPDGWQGRFLIATPPAPGLQPPPGTQPGSPQPQQGAPAATTIQLTSPLAGETLGGVVTLTVHTENVSGVRFDAYYATDPSNVNTVGWHTLGQASPTGGGNWSMPYDTHAIPDQGSAGWGTVNVMVIALDAAGDTTAARDWHRVAISNAVAAPQPQPQPQPQPPPPPAFYVYHVVGTCGEGACGLKKRAGPGSSNYAQVGVVYDGQEIRVVCQTLGQAVSGRNATSSIWDRLTDGSYVSDYYTDTPVVGGFSPPIPRC